MIVQRHKVEGILTDADAGVIIMERADRDRQYRG
jgi:hypothetical protein